MNPKLPICQMKHSSSVLARHGLAAASAWHAHTCRGPRHQHAAMKRAVIHVVKMQYAKSANTIIHCYHMSPVSMTSRVSF